MEKITINIKAKENGWGFDVKVSDKDTSTKHKVTMSRTYYEQLGTNTPPEEVIRKSFEFLLERESKESILAEFNIEVIEKYFPDYKAASKKF